MPVKSEKQRRAMQAAASGKSTIGIPKAVGREFVGAPKQQRAQPMKRPPEMSAVTPAMPSQGQNAGASLKAAIMSEMRKR